MENEKILLNLASQLEDLKRQVLRMSKKDYDMHRLDIDILQNVIRGIYEQVLELEETAENEAEVQEEIEVPVIPVLEEKEVIQPEIETIAEEEVLQETLEIPEPEAEVVAEEEVLEEILEISDQEDEAVVEEEIVGVSIEIPEPETEIPQVVEFEIEAEEEVIEEPKPEVVVEEKILQESAVDENVKEEKRTVRSTIDLFSTTAEPTISDKFLHDKEPSIADKMRQTHISDLRQAIGINEKFLFINELFNGDMGKYNMALDELNEMKTSEGVITYFIELKIHNQWKDDSEAFIKFKEVLDRKIE